MNSYKIYISFSLIAGAAFGTPPILHTTQSASQVMNWLQPTTIVTTPEPAHAGVLRRHEGSSFSTGNLLVEIPLTTLGFSLYYNSIASERQLGFGRGFSLSIERTVYLKDSNSGFLVAGDGSNYPLARSGSSTNWTPVHQTELNSKFSKQATSPYFFQEKSTTGSILTFNSFTPSSINGPFAISNIRDLFGNEISFQRNAQKQIESILYPHERRISFTIIEGLVTSISGKNGENYHFLYDENARLNVIIYPDGSAWEIEYDQGTALIAQLTNSDGFTTQYRYYIGGVVRGILSRGRLTQISYTSRTVTTAQTGNRLTETFIHQNNIPGITSEDNNGIKAKWERNPDGSVKRFIDHFGQSTRYTYSPGNPFPTMIEYPPYEKITYTYNTDNRLRSATFLEGLGQQKVEKIFNYDPENGGVLTSRSTNGRTINYSYDRGALTRVNTPTGAIFYSSAYDNEGNRTSSMNENGETTSYTYSRGNLISLTDPLGRTTHFTYDELGNILSASDNEAILSQEYNEIGIPLGNSRTTLLASGIILENDTTLLRSSNSAISFAAQSIRVDGQMVFESRNTYDTTAPGRLFSFTVRGPIGPAIDLLRD